VTNTNLVIVQKVPDGTRGKLKLYLKRAKPSVHLANFRRQRLHCQKMNFGWRKPSKVVG
jgi:hypothetical protein